MGEILAGNVPEVVSEQFEKNWESYTVGDDLVTIHDADLLVQASTKAGEFVILSGSRLDFTGVTDWLEDTETGIDNTPYHGETMWGDDILAFVMLEKDGLIATGDTGAIKEALKVKARGSGSLAQDTDGAVRKAYDEASMGWYVRVSEDCEEFSESLRACEAYSVSAGQGKEDYLVEISYRLLFRSEQRAESQASDIEDLFDDTDWDADLDRIASEGSAVEASLTGDQEDFDYRWLIYLNRLAPHVLESTAIRATPTRPAPSPRATSASSTPTPTTAPPAPENRAPLATRAPAPSATPAPRTRASAATEVPEAGLRVEDPCVSRITSPGLIKSGFSFGCRSLERPGSFSALFVLTLKKEAVAVIDIYPSGDDHIYYLYHGLGDAGPVIFESNERTEIQLPAGDYTIEVTNPVTYNYQLSVTFPYEN